MKGMKLLVSLVAAVGLVVVCAGWDQVNTSVDGLNVKGSTFKIDGTAVTASAAELNKVDGYTGTAANLNSAVGLVSAVPAATLTGNIALARMTNLTTQGTAFTTNPVVVSLTTSGTNVIRGAQAWVFQGPMLYSIGSTTYTTNGVE